MLWLVIGRYETVYAILFQRRTAWISREILFLSENAVGNVLSHSSFIADSDIGYYRLLTYTAHHTTECKVYVTYLTPWTSSVSKYKFILTAFSLISFDYFYSDVILRKLLCILIYI